MPVRHSLPPNRGRFVNGLGEAVQEATFRLMYFGLSFQAACLGQCGSQANIQRALQRLPVKGSS